MASNEQILNEANYYLGNNVNVDQASQALGISRRTFQLHMKKLEEIHPIKAAMVRAKRTGNIKAGNIKGGQISKRGVSYTSEEATKAAFEMIQHDESYREVSTILGIPKSTLYEMINSKGLSPDKIESLYVIAKKENPELELTDFLNKFYNSAIRAEETTNEYYKPNSAKK